MRFKRMGPAVLLALELTDTCTAFPSSHLSGGFLFLFRRFSRKRIDILFHTYLLCDFIFFDLILYVLRYCRFITSYRIDIISAAPEISIPEFIF